MLWSQIPTANEITDQRGRASFDALVLGKDWRSSPTPGRLRDSYGQDYIPSTGYSQLPGVQANTSGYGASYVAYATALAQSNPWPRLSFSGATSVRAKLTESLEAVVLSLTLSDLNSTTTRAYIELDKPASPSLFVKRLDAGGNEGAMLTAADDESGGTKSRTLDFARQSGRYRVIVRVGGTKYYRDYQDGVALTALSTYASSSESTLAGTYDDGVADGRRAFAQDIYPLGDADGFDSAGVLAGPNWDTSATRQSFRDTIARKNSIEASKVFLNQLVANGAPAYNGSSNDPNYYTGLAASYVTTVKQLGGVSAYHAVYGQYPSFTYNTASQDGTYLDGLKDDFVLQIQQDSTASGYSNAYNEVWNAASTELLAAGIPEGYGNWSLATPKNAAQAANLIRWSYNSGYVKAAQTLYDEGLPDGFDFRPLTTEADPLSSSASRDQYALLKDDYRAKLQAVGKINGLKHVLEQARTQYGFAYDHTNAGNLSDPDYALYLEAQRDPMLTKVADEGKVIAYRDVYDGAVTLFKFTYNPNQSASALAGLKSALYTAVYSYGIVVELQKLYDLGAATYFDELTNYPAVRDPTYASRDQYRDAKALALAALEGDFFQRTYDMGVIFTYRDRMFPYAVPFGFVYDATQREATYYADLEDEFIAALRGGYGTASIVGHSVAWEGNVATVQVTLNKPAKVAGWFSRGARTVGSVVDSNAVSVSHTLAFTLPKGVAGQTLTLNLEVSN